jgi:hypothetical protein
VLNWLVRHWYSAPSAGARPGVSDQLKADRSYRR